MSRRTVVCGDYKITASETGPFEGTTAGKVDTHGLARVYDVRGPQLRITVIDVAWYNGERDVRTIDRHASPMKFDRLVHGLRIGVHVNDPTPSTALRLDLKQAQGREGKKWPSARQADRVTLDAGAGCDVAAALLASGATVIESRETAIGDTSTHRNALCVLFPSDAVLVPPLAYVLTRIAPIANDFSP